jgi:hypothetical protein
MFWCDTDKLGNIREAQTGPEERAVICRAKLPTVPKQALQAIPRQGRACYIQKPKIIFEITALKACNRLNKNGIRVEKCQE